MVLVIGEPIVPATTDPRSDRRIRLQLTRSRMHDVITQGTPEVA
jgi:hypothetical protein